MFREIYSKCFSFSNKFIYKHIHVNKELYDFLVTVMAAPHECVLKTGQP